MSGLVLSRRSLLEAAALGVGALVAAGFPAAALATASPSVSGTSAVMLAAWVVLRPEAGADLRFAYLGAEGRTLSLLPAVRVDARRPTPAGRPASAWGQAQEAAELAQSLAKAMAASAWGVPASECAVLSGRIAHSESGRSIRHCVWLDVV